MIDYSRMEIVRMVSNNNGSLSAREARQVRETMENEDAYFMDGVHHIRYMDDGGRPNEARVDLRVKKVEEVDLPVLDI